MKERLFTVLILAWIFGGTAISATIPAPDDQEEPSVAASGNGYFIVWADKRNYANDEYDIYGARVSKSGEVLDPDGIPICTNPGRQTSPRVAFNGSEFLVVWEDDRESTTNFVLYQIYGARVTADGQVLDTNGFKITTNPIARTGPAVASDGNSFFAVWVDWYRSSNSIAIFGSPISADGLVSNPDGISLAQGPSPDADPRIAYASGQYLVTYLEGSQIRGLRIGTGGVPLSSPFAISSQTANDRHGLASNGRDFFEIWGDYRNSPPGLGYPHIYGTLILSNGAVLNPGGLPISTNGYYAERPRITSDILGFVAVWQESNNPTNGVADIYGARLTANGQIGNPARITVNRSPGIQMNPDIAGVSTNVLAVWQDGRSAPDDPFPFGAFDIYGTLLNGLALNTNGLLISTIQTTNQPPTAIPQFITSTQGFSFSITLAATDPDNDQLTYRILSPPSFGFVTGAPPHVLYYSTTNLLTTVTDSFTFAASDGVAESSPATITLLLFPQSSDTNTLPIISLLSNDSVASEALNSDGTTNTATFSIQRGGNPTNDLSVSLFVHGSATYGSDYYTVPPLLGLFSNSTTSVFMPAGSTSADFILYPIPDNLAEGSEFAIFTINTNSTYVLGSPSQITVTILDSNTPPVAGTRVFFPPNGANYASPLDIKVRVSNTNLSNVKLYADGQLLASYTPAPALLALVTNFSVGPHTIYSVGNDSVTSSPVHFQVLAPLAQSALSPTPGIAAEANASFVLDSNGALFDFGDGRLGALADGYGPNLEPNNLTARPIQIPLPAGTNRFLKISSGTHHTLALTADGSLWTSGDNSSGQIGQGKSTATFVGFATIPEFPSWKDIAAGNAHSLALDKSGKLMSCGNNLYGQLGLGNNTNSSVFQIVPFPAGVAAWTAIAAGSNYSIALADNGNLYACGMGIFGTLGTGGETNSSRFVPVSLPTGVTNWLKVTAGAQHVLAIAGNRALYAWGLGTVGQLGNGSFGVSPVPRLVTPPAGVSNWLALAAGLSHSLGIGNDGNLYGWGNSALGQLGPGPIARPVPTLIPPPGRVSSWTTIASGVNHSLGLGDNCTLYAWGANNFGQLGIGSTTNQTNEVAVSDLTDLCSPPTVTITYPTDGSVFPASANIFINAEAAAHGAEISRIDLFENGALLASGTNTPFSFIWSNIVQGTYVLTAAAAHSGSPTSFSTSAPVNITVVSSNTTLPVVSIQATDGGAAEPPPTNNGTFTFFRGDNLQGPLTVLFKLSGTATLNSDYQTSPPLASGTTNTINFLTIPPNYNSATLTVIPMADSILEPTETVVVSLLTNSSYRIGGPGNATVNIVNNNTNVSPLTEIIFPRDGAIFASSLDIELRVASTNIPGIKLYADSNLLAIAAAPPGNSSFVFSVVTNFSAGLHVVYSVGYPNVTSAPVHFLVLGTNAISSRFPSLGVMPTANSSFVVDANGAAFAWGDDRYGNLGDGGLTNIGTGVSLPIQISLPESLFEIANPFLAQRWTKISAGTQHTLLLSSLGIPYVTGGNSFGQTGRGTSVTTVKPLLLSPSGTIRCKDITAGGQHSLALTLEGQLYAWGYNAFGQLGLGNTTNVSFPHLVPFPPGVTNWTAIAAGNNHSLALDDAGNLYAWGSGVDGILGTGGTTNSSRPLKVVLPTGVNFWTKISAGSTHNLALANDGKLYAWGAGFAGQLGIGYAADENVPVPVLAPTNVSTWREISAGHEHSLGIADNGKVYLWGVPTAGASLPFVFLPTPVSNPDGVDSWSRASAGWGHSVALGDNCALYSIGLNSFGQLGIGSFMQQTNLQIVKNLGDLCTGILVSETNHAPSYVKGPDITVPANAGLQVFTNWATRINLGAPSETNQTLTFMVTNDNPHLFSTQPGIVPLGNLFFASAPNSNGVAHVTVVLRDNGGTANGGQDTSAPQTFVITIKSPNHAPIPVVRVFPSFVLSSNYSVFQVISPNGTNALVFFDASLSSDIDGDLLSFAWFAHGTNDLFGTTVVATNTLRLGTNTLALSVNDGDITVFQPFVVEVITPGTAVAELINLIESLAPRSALKQLTSRQLITPLQSAESEFDSELWNAALVHLRIFQSRVSDQIGESDPVLANYLIRTAQQIADVVQSNSKHQPSINSIQNRAANHKSLTFTGSPGQVYLVQASTDLSHWETIGIATENDAGSFQFDDSANATATARYYRLVVP